MTISRRDFLAGSTAFAGAMTVWAVSAQGAKPQPITASHSVNTTIYAAHMVADAKGLMQDQGLTLHVIEARGGSNVRRILAAGQVGYALGDSSHPLQLTNRGRASKILMATDNRCSYANIIARKELVDKGIDSIEKLAEYKQLGSRGLGPRGLGPRGLGHGSGHFLGVEAAANDRLPTRLSNIATASA